MIRSVTDARTKLVERGYDAIADAYVEWSSRIVGDPKLEHVALLSERLPAGARCLELGCGAGEPCTRALAERFRVTAVDVSVEQIRRARHNLPQVDFVQADFLDIDFDPESFDAVVAVYALNHVPRELLGALFARIHRWLRPDGLFLASLGASDTEGSTEDWLGTTMFFSGWEPDVNRRLLSEAGFEISVDRLVTMREPAHGSGTDATFHWVMCQRRHPQAEGRGAIR